MSSNKIPVIVLAQFCTTDGDTISAKPDETVRLSPELAQRFVEVGLVKYPTPKKITKKKEVKSNG